MYVWVLWGKVAGKDEIYRCTEEWASIWRNIDVFDEFKAVKLPHIHEGLPNLLRSLQTPFTIHLNLNIIIKVIGFEFDDIVKGVIIIEFLLSNLLNYFISSSSTFLAE